MGQKSDKISEVVENSDAFRQTRVQTLQNILLVWLDQNSSDKSPDSCSTIAQLNQITRELYKFNDPDECIIFIQNNRNCILLIVSGTLGQQVVPNIHDLSQVYSIFVFCRNQSYHTEWVKRWCKIQGVYTSISPICEIVRETEKLYKENSTMISFAQSSSHDAAININCTDPTFAYAQVLKEILLSITYEKQHRKRFFDFMRQQFSDTDDKRELENVKQLEENYHKFQPAHWYSQESFLHGMVNKALRELDMTVIIKMAFFISDLYLCIDRLYNVQYVNNRKHKKFKLYRGQVMSSEDFEKIKKLKDSFMCFLNFLSTSKDKSVSFDFVQRSLRRNVGKIGIQFVIHMDSFESLSPFASIKEVSAFPNENEILFCIPTVFRIREISPMDKHGCSYRVNLAPVNYDDKDYHNLTERIRAENYPYESGWNRLGSILLKMGYVENAMEVFENVSHQNNGNEQKASLQMLIGSAKFENGKYEEAAILYEHALQLRSREVSTNDSSLADIYNNIGLAYSQLNQYSKALAAHMQALEIRIQSLLPTHLKVAASYVNIGLLYQRMGQRNDAISYFDQALEIQERSLSPAHLDLAATYNNKGNIYYELKDYSQALTCYEKNLTILKQSLAVYDPHFAKCYTNIGLVHTALEEYQTALSFFEKAIEIREKSFPSGHPTLAANYNSMGSVYFKMGNYSKAIFYHEKAVAIGNHMLLSTHSDLKKWKQNLELARNMRT